MTPYYQDGFCTIYQGDCLDVLPEIDTRGAILIADPPYGMRLDTDFSQMEGKLHNHKTCGRRYDPVIGDEGDYDPRPIIDRVRCKEQFWFGADYYAERLPDKNRGSWLCWDKRISASRDKMFGSSFELIWSAVRRKRWMLRYTWAGSFGMERDELGVRCHPTQKPTLLYRRLISMTKSPRLIIDPYMGSGTSLRAAKDLGIKAIGIELEEKFCELAVRRLRQEILPLEPCMLPA